MPKAQISIEYLMVYSLSILSVLAIIGTLGYFGVMNPLGLLPDKCTFGILLHCDDHQVDQNEITIILRNGIGREMIIRQISASSQALGDGSRGQSCQLAASDIPLKINSNYRFLLDTPIQPGACDYKDLGLTKNRYNISVIYSWADSQNINHVIDGEIMTGRP